MNDKDMAELRSPRAMVCKQQHRADCGVGTVWFVCLADGYLIDCGADSESHARAQTLAAAVNAAKPEAFYREALMEWGKA